jgi:hypothetical protein
VQTDTAPNTRLQPTAAGAIMAAAAETQTLAKGHGDGCLQIFWAKSSVLRQAGVHVRPDLVIVVKRKHDIRPAVSGERPV